MSLTKHFKHIKVTCGPHETHKLIITRIEIHHKYNARWNISRTAYRTSCKTSPTAITIADNQDTIHEIHISGKIERKQKKNECYNAQNIIVHHYKSFNKPFYILNFNSATLVYTIIFFRHTAPTGYTIL
jgi:hypothetical protein